MLNPVRLIAAKRDGRTLDPADIRAFIDAYTAGTIPDYQASAFLMAAFLRGMNDAETLALADSMLHSGQVLSLKDLPGLKVDKHSTGGVGDKVSLILSPLVAACGVPVPMISGRGLGHTGGTLDKLESIPGFRTNLSIAQYRDHLARYKMVMIGQTEEIAPADRKLYALRDVTATVEFIPFIAASIMSKKLAAGLDALVLDVKCGRGAFMKSESDARRLAETLVRVGLRAGTPTVAHLTRMDVPLGRSAGNWPEVVESIQLLQGHTTGLEDLWHVTRALAGEMIYLGGKAKSPEDGEALATHALLNGHAWKAFETLVEAQGGSLDAIRAPYEREGYEPADVLEAPVNGHVSDLDALAVGMLTVEMGAGRLAKEDPVDPTAGLVFHAKPGDMVMKGQPLASLYTRRTGRIEEFKASLLSAYTFNQATHIPGAVLIDRFDGSTWRSY